MTAEYIAELEQEVIRLRYEEKLTHASAVKMAVVVKEMFQALLERPELADIHSELKISVLNITQIVEGK